MKVVTVGEYGSAPTKDAIRRACHARRHRLHPTGKRMLACGFHDHVHVVGLDRVVRDPEAPALACRSEAAFELTHEIHAP
jgi:hypothetical protein